MGYELISLKQTFAKEYAKLKFWPESQAPALNAGGNFVAPAYEELFLVWKKGRESGAAYSPPTPSPDEMEEIVFDRLKRREETRDQKLIRRTEEQIRHDNTCHLRSAGLLF